MVQGSGLNSKLFNFLNLNDPSLPPKVEEEAMEGDDVDAQLLEEKHLNHTR